MARTELTVETIDRDGLTPTMTPLAADGHSFLNDGRLTRLLVVNDATAFVLTIQTPKTVDGLEVADRPISIPASATVELGPFPADTYNQSDGAVYIDYDDVTDGAVNVARLGT